MQYSLDNDQRRAVETERTTVVTAGAGSGKTTVLAERYLWLLEKRGARVQEILALTFTQKAAAEMYERIYRRLEEQGEEAVSHLREFDQAQISTLDSFCAQLARDGAGLFGLPPTLRHDEQGAARLAADLALEFLLARWREPPVAELLRVHDFRTLWEELFTHLAVEQFHLAAREDLNAVAERQLEECGRAIGRQWAEVAGALAELAAIPPRTPTMRRNHDAALRLAAASPHLAAGRYRELEGAAAECLAAWSLKGGGRAEDWLRMKELVAALRDTLLPGLGELAGTLARRDALRGVFGLLERFRQAFLARKRALGLATFRDVAEMAVQALRRDPALRQHYKSRFRYILIDEFQDNNRLQKELLFLLAERQELCLDRVPEAAELEPDKLFFVGDEKQSIYRFRGADVSVFTSLTGELRRAGGSSLRLDRNYRSAPGLVEFCNGLFTRVMAGAARGFEARYQPMQAADLPASAAQVHLLYQEAAEEGSRADLLSRAEAEAYAVALFIRESLETGRFPITEGGSERPARLEDFTILLRSTTHQVHFERLLRHFDLPYSTPNVRSLFMEAPLNDLYQLLRLAVAPEDRRAYAAVLRSPWVNASDTAFLAILLAPPAAEPFSGLDALALGPEDRGKLEHGRTLYAFVREQADRLGHGALVHALWHRWGYRHFLLGDPRSHNSLEFYEYLVELAARAEGDTLAAFLEQLREDLGRYRRLEDLEVLPARARGVQLLTIHKAKGLEFPIVVLADAGNTGRGGLEKRPYYLSDSFGITLDLGQGSYFARIGEEETAAKELAEARRLLYVALTRARSHLIVAGTARQAGGRAEHAHLDMVLRALDLDARAPGVTQGPAGPVRLHLIPAVPRARLAARAPAQPPAVLESVYAGPPLRRPALRREYAVSQVNDLLEAGVVAGFPPLAGEKRELPGLAVDPLLAELEREAAFGTLTHDLLAAWLREPAGPPPEADWSRLGIAPEHRAACLAGALELCRRFLDSPLGRLAAAAADRRTELPFVFRWTGTQGPLYLSGQLDLVFASGGKTYLVDFKTDRQHRDGQYEVQLGLYALAYAELAEPAAPAERRQVVPLIFWLRGGQAVPVERPFDWEALLAGLPR
jgi:ATP-dependent exoDNAse (exonuclease V) beta subunit